MVFLIIFPLLTYVYQATNQQYDKMKYKIHRYVKYEKGLKNFEEKYEYHRGEYKQLVSHYEHFIDEDVGPLCCEEHDKRHRKRLWLKEIPFIVSIRMMYISLK
jgi:hypothetical protein